MLLGISCLTLRSFRRVCLASPRPCGQRASAWVSTLHTATILVSTFLGRSAMRSRTLPCAPPPCPSSPTVHALGGPPHSTVGVWAWPGIKNGALYSLKMTGAGTTSHRRALIWAPSTPCEMPLMRQESRWCTQSIGITRTLRGRAVIAVPTAHYQPRPTCGVSAVTLARTGIVSYG